MEMKNNRESLNSIYVKMKMVQVEYLRLIWFELTF